MNFIKTIDKLNRYYQQLCKSPQRPLTEENVKKFCERDVPGIYVFYKKENESTLIKRYVGSAVNLRRRIQSQHLSKSNRVSSSPFRVKLVREEEVNQYSDRTLRDNPSS